MNGVAGPVVSESGRARPLSGGLWSLLGWLRRDERASSSDSLSSAGSDRSAVSFAFFAPAAPLAPHAPPAALPPLAATDSYKKRVHDRNLRRQQDRDLTLHRKYGLYYGYDAFSLPPARKTFNETTEEPDRERRANSESLTRRPAHVPGKRRAPLPPARTHSLYSTSSLGRRQNRKRPAPQPPVIKAKENLQPSENYKRDFLALMNSKPDSKRNPLSNVNGDQPKKHDKKNKTSKDTKPQSEKSFLKQIFENRHRSSVIDPVPERILPSISELDKQAAEIIESCRLKPLEPNNNLSSRSTETETWFCTRCLRKYDSTIVTCQHCLPEQKRLSNGLRMAASTASSTQTEKEALTNIPSSRISGIGDEEKQKLKEMLKEMKNSLPKRPKHDASKQKDSKIFAFDLNRNDNSSSLDTATLRIGASIVKENISDVLPQPSTSKQFDENERKIPVRDVEKVLPLTSAPVTEQVIITQPVVLVGPQPKKHNPKSSEPSVSKISETSVSVTKQNTNQINPNVKLNTDLVEINNIHTPLRISSLLNPVYIPKAKQSDNEARRSLFFSQHEAHKQNIEGPESKKPIDRLPPISDIPPTLQTKTSVVKETPLEVKDEKSNVTEKSSAKNIVVENKQKVTQKSNFAKPGPSAQPVSKSVDEPMPNVASSSSTAPVEKARLIDSNMVKFTTDQHARRRELINQLEKSISSGDEKAAADAAVKLAQLRLSCSVLSFTSQIIADHMKASTSNSDQRLTDDIKEKAPTNKVNVAVQSTATASSNNQAKNKSTFAVKKEDQESKPRPSDCKTKQAENNLRKIVPTQPSTSKQIANENTNLATIQVWVEDREATRGPLRLHIPRQAVIADLRQQAETALGLASGLQRWIVGRTLCTDDRTTLTYLAGPDLSAPFYLCVVEDNKAGPSNIASGSAAIPQNDKPLKQEVCATSVVYSELVQLEQRALVVNAEPFECGVCVEECAIGNGAVLRECVHTFCRQCLSDLIRHCEEPLVSCPAVGCPAVLQEREIRALVTPEEYERWLARGLAAAESGTRNAFHCRTRDCTGWALCDPGVRKFPCPVCKKTNCIPCQAIHEGETCEQHRRKVQESAASDGLPTDAGTQALLDTLITKGEALMCPECSAIITKKWGCDWVKCSACKTEICWVTRGRRWGPGGKGDTSGGCRCGVDGKKCHPSCGYCH